MMAFCFCGRPSQAFFTFSFFLVLLYPLEKIYKEAFQGARVVSSWRRFLSGWVCYFYRFLRYFVCWVYFLFWFGEFYIDLIVIYCRLFFKGNLLVLLEYIFFCEKILKLKEGNRKDVHIFHFQLISIIYTNVWWWEEIILSWIWYLI